MLYTLLILFTIESSFTTVIMSHDIPVQNRELCEKEAALLVKKMEKKNYKVLPDVFCVQTGVSFVKEHNH